MVVLFVTMITGFMVRLTVVIKLSHPVAYLMVSLKVPAKFMMAPDGMLYNCPWQIVGDNDLIVSSFTVRLVVIMLSHFPGWLIVVT